MSKRFIACILSVLLCLAAVLTIYAAAGSSDDPLVTKSYVDDKINQLINTSGSVNANAQTDVQQLKAEILAELSSLVSNSSNNSADTAQVSLGSYIPVYVQAGQIILGGEGTELILRSGKANVYVTGVAGIVNATSGKELVNGNKADLNNIMIIPRNDGRGFKVSESAWFLVKGEYEIK